MLSLPRDGCSEEVFAGLQIEEKELSSVVGVLMAVGALAVDMAVLLSLLLVDLFEIGGARTPSSSSPTDADAGEA